MGLKTGNFPPVDLETFLQEPLRHRVKTLALHWGEYGFGSAAMIPLTSVSYTHLTLPTTSRV